MLSSVDQDLDMVGKRGKGKQGISPQDCHHDLAQQCHRDPGHSDTAGSPWGNSAWAVSGSGFSVGSVCEWVWTVGSGCMIRICVCQGHEWVWP